MRQGKVRRIWRWGRSFVADTQGALLTETLIVVPVVTIFAVGILEFGNVFWQRHQVQVGVRDAARYWARCHQDDVFNTCSEQIAANLALYGQPSTSTTLRVPGWDDPDSLDFSALPDRINPLPTDDGYIVTVTGTHTYTGSPLMRLLQIEAFDFSYTHQQRYIGW
ncbi:MAG: pilus assembly protein [Rhodobacterales bacterium]|nr:pilus assembly protein [Rhodobacterales bacterium]